MLVACMTAILIVGLFSLGVSKIPRFGPLIYHSECRLVTIHPYRPSSGPTESLVLRQPTVRNHKRTFVPLRTRMPAAFPFVTILRARDNLATRMQVFRLILSFAVRRVRASLKTLALNERSSFDPTAQSGRFKC